MKLQEIKKIIKLCKQNGVSRIKIADFEVEIDLSVTSDNRVGVRAKKEDESLQDLIPKVDLTQMPTDEEMLFAAVDGIVHEDISSGENVAP